MGFLLYSQNEGRIIHKTSKNYVFTLKYEECWIHYTGAHLVMTSPSITRPQTNNHKRKLFYVWVCLLMAWFIMAITPLLGGMDIGLADYNDLKVYFQRGKWFTENKPLVSEYPQIPTLLFGVNHAASMWFDADLQLGVYVVVMTLEMLIILYLVFKVLLELLPPHLSRNIYLLFLPPTLYFTFYRFDILPAYLCLIAFGAATKQQWMKTALLLALGTFTKWYPILLFPGFFIYASLLEKKFQWKMVWVFIATGLAILLLSYLQGGLITLTAPFKFHLARGMEYAALPVIVNNSLHNFLNININLRYMFPLFFIIQVSAPLLVLFTKLDTLDALVDYCIIVIGVFVLFSRIWSPQWLLWLVPFLLLSSKNAQTIWLLIAYNLTSYICFPIIFAHYGGSSYQLQIASLSIYITLIAIIARSIRNTKFTNMLIRLKMLTAMLKPDRLS